jgi:energy-coupling factor transporter ATP-binding protein EcfA2
MDRMRVARLSLKDLGPFAEAVFEFPDPLGPGELVLFEGPNGSGKTTVVQTLALLVSGLCAQLDPGSLLAEPPLASWRRRCLTAPLVEARLTHEGASLDLKLDAAGGSQSVGAGANVAADALHFYQSAARAAAQPVAWAAFAYLPHQLDADLKTAGPREIEEVPLRGALSFGGRPASPLLGQLLTNLENERTKALAYAQEDADPRRREDLERMAASRRSAVMRFEHVLSRVLDRRVSVEFSMDRQAPRIRFDGEDLPFDLLGEGLRSTFAWLSDLLVRLHRVTWADPTLSVLDQRFWLILDEIDEGLHPALQARVLPALRELFPNACIYAATHSPFVVASVGEGTVFSIRPGADRRVRGAVPARRLALGQSLEVVAAEVFGVPAEFVDEDTRGKLEAHERDVKDLERGAEIDWSAFFARRDALMARNDEVRAAVSMQELSVRQTILRARREGDPRGSP